MKEHQITSLDNFIGAWTPDDTSICDELIEYHKNNQYKGPGLFAGGQLNLAVKDSTDCGIHDPLLLFRYDREYLQPIVEKYKEKYPWCNNYGEWKPETYPGIQHYAPGGGFYIWHTERLNGLYPGRNRHLVFMTYLNDVNDAGETEFYHQKLKVKPEKGLTLIWPADWTFTHRGIPSMTEDKYIVTGWYSFVDGEQLSE